MRSTAAAALTLVSGAHAFWRMPCRSETGIARMDPIMDKGEISDHVHTIAGSGSKCPTSDQRYTGANMIAQNSAWMPPMRT
jgi:hypothetical protein